MKRLPIIVFLFFFTLFSCTPDNNNEENSNQEINNLKMEIEISTNKFQIDQPISFTVNTNENITEINTSTNNWVSSHGATSFMGTNQGKSIKVFQSFSEIGQKTIYVAVKNEKMQKVEKSFQVEIIKGGAVKIKSIKLLSFKNINGSWDKEYPSDNINRLADLAFALEKRYIMSSFNEIEYSFEYWRYNETLENQGIFSETLENQGNLTWDLNNKNLYIDPYSDFIFHLLDIDKNNASEDLLNDLNNGYLNFIEYIQSKPSTITLKKGDLEIQFDLEW